MKAIAGALLLAALYAGSAHAVSWGMNCRPSSNPCTTESQAVVVAQRLHMDFYVVRVGVPHPIAKGLYASIAAARAAGAVITVPTQGVDPIVDGTHVKVDNAAAFSVNDPITSDVYPPGTTVTGKSGFTLTLSASATQYINAATNYGVLSPGGLYSALSAATPNPIPIELIIFNNVNGSASDTAEIGCTSAVSCPSTSQAYKDDIDYMLEVQIAGAGMEAPFMLRADNEEDGSSSSTCNGTSGITQGNCSVSLAWSGEQAYDGGNTAWWYFPKLHDVVNRAHAHGMLAVGSGVTVIGDQLTYWNNLWGGCSVGSCSCVGLTACRVAADIYQQGGFSKSLQQSNLAGSLPTSCNVFSPPLRARQTARAARTLGIIQDEITAGVDISNHHWYDIYWQSQAADYAWVKSVTGLPIMFDEWAPYSLSAYDMVTMAEGMTQVGAVYAAQWNQESAGNFPLARGLSNTDGTLRGSALWFLAYRGFTGSAYSGGPVIPPYPNLLTGPPPPTAFGC